MPAGPPARDPGHGTGSAAVPYRPALAMLATLFFMWGFITVINGTLLPHLRSVMVLNYQQTTLIESVWFIAYFVASIPAAKIIERIGYKMSLVYGLIVMALGALLMIPASMVLSYGIVLVAMFVIASGITLLQVAANPYVAVIGPPEFAASRLNLMQAFNSMGTTLAPLFGAYLILGRSVSGTAQGGAASLPLEQRLADAQAVQLPYLIVAAVLVLLAVTIARFRLPAIGASVSRAPRETGTRHSLWKHPLWQHRNLVFGIPAIAFYVLAEIGVGNLFVNFVSQHGVGNMSQKDAGHYLFLLWGGMMVGRFVGSYLTRAVAPETVLAWASVLAFGMMIVTTYAHGHIAMWSLIAVGLFHSIMFPTIFSLSIKGLGPLTEEGSGLLVMAIAGGALVFIQGRFADAHGLQASFIIPALCELYVLFYALWGARVNAPQPEPR